MAPIMGDKRISDELAEGKRLSYTESIFILISVAFGVGYVDVFSSNQNNYTSSLGASFTNLLIGIISVYMLADIKANHKNKLGSY